MELALRAAAAADPEHAAWRDAPSHPDTAAARERRGAAYRAMFGLLLSLLGAGDAAPLRQVFPLEVAPAAAAGGQGAAAPALRDMTPAEVSAAKKEMLQVGVCVCVYLRGVGVGDWNRMVGWLTNAGKGNWLATCTQPHARLCCCLGAPHCAPPPSNPTPTRPPGKPSQQAAAAVQRVCAVLCSITISFCPYMHML